MALVRGERLRLEMLRKRRANLFEKANELAGKTDSKIYVVVQNDNKFHTYKSTDNLYWLCPRERNCEMLLKPNIYQLLKHVEVVLLMESHVFNKRSGHWFKGAEE